MKAIHAALKECERGNYLGKWKNPGTHLPAVQNLTAQTAELLVSEEEIRNDLILRIGHATKLSALAASLSMTQARDMQGRLTRAKRALSIMLEGNRTTRSKVSQYDREIVQCESQLKILEVLKSETIHARDILTSIKAMSLPPTTQVQARLRKLEEVVGRVEAATLSGDSSKLRQAWSETLLIKDALSQESESEVARSVREIECWVSNADLNPRLAGHWKQALTDVLGASRDADFIERWTSLRSNIGSAVEADYWRRVSDMKSDVLSKKKLSSFGIRKERLPWSAVEKLARLTRLSPMPRALSDVKGGDLKNVDHLNGDAKCSHY